MACWQPKRDITQLMDQIFFDKRYNSVKEKVKDLADKERISMARYIFLHKEEIIEEMTEVFEKNFCRLCLPFVKLIGKIFRIFERN